MKTRHLLPLLILLVGCSGSPSLQVTGGAGRDIHDPMAQIIQDQYLIEYSIQNTASSEFIFDRVEERWSPQGQGGGLTQTVLPRGGPWTLKGEQSKRLVSGTDGYTLQLHDEARGRAVEFSFTLYRGDSKVAGPFTTVLPQLRDLPRCDQNILSLRSRDEPLPKELANLPAPKLQPVTFSQ